MKNVWSQRSVIIVLAVLVLGCALGAQQGQPPAKTAEYKIPPEDAQRANSVKPSPESLARGRKIYGMDCAVCHGVKGDGKGDIGDMKNITDFTNPDALKDRSDGQLFYIIRKGKGEMPPEGERAKDDDIWSMVNYIRAFAKK